MQGLLPGRCSIAMPPFLPPTRYARGSGYVLLLFPELTLWAKELPSLNGTLNSLRPPGAARILLRTSHFVPRTSQWLAQLTFHIQNPTSKIQNPEFAGINLPFWGGGAPACACCRFPDCGRGGGRRVAGAPAWQMPFCGCLRGGSCHLVPYRTPGYYP